MSLDAGRIRRVLLACAASAAVLFASAAPLLAGHLPSDRECAPAIVEHDHAAHRMRSAPDAGADHCAACHLTRTARDTSFAHVLIAAGPPARAVVELTHDTAFLVDLHQDFNRGPPASRTR